MPFRLVGGPEEDAAQFIQQLVSKGVLDNKGNVVPEELGRDAEGRLVNEPRPSIQRGSEQPLGQNARK